MKTLSILLIALFSHSLLASDAARLLMEKGLYAHEGLTDFISTHPCELGADKTCERPLTSKDIAKLKTLLRSLEEWRRLAFEGFAPMAKTEVEYAHKVVIGEKLNIEESTWFNTTTFRREKFLTITLNLEEKESQIFINNTRAALATTLLLYDSYFRLAQAVSKAKNLRSILQYDLPDEGAFLSKTYAIATDEKLWTKTTHAVNFMKSVKPFKSDSSIFEQYNSKSFVGARMAAGDVNYRILSAMFMNQSTAQAEFFEGLNKFVGILSKLFGNTAGMVQTRDGKLKSLAANSDEMKRLKSLLKPMDILLEKTPMRLTDKFIPGFYGHVAIWLGSADELARLEVNHNGTMIPLLMHPDVLPHLEKLSQGKLIVEALRKPGVTMNTLEHFMDIDDFVILKTPAMDDETLARHVLKTFQQVGKLYDFNFDVSTEREIVCSELIYTVFTEYVWPTSVSLGRFTINPDQVAWKAVDTCFEPVLMYHDGKQIKSSMKSELKRLLGLPGGISYTPSGQCLKLRQPK